MKRQKIQMAVLLLALAVLGAGILALRRYNASQENKEQEPADVIQITELNGEDIIKISYEYEGETYTFEKREDTWYDADDGNRALTQYRIKAIANRLASMTAVQVIPEVTDPGQYGLAEGYRTIGFETPGASYIFYAGDKNAVTSNYYICKPSERTVYAVDSLTVTQFNYTPEDFEDQ